MARFGSTIDPRERYAHTWPERLSQPKAVERILGLVFFLLSSLRIVPVPVEAAIAVLAAGAGARWCWRRVTRVRRRRAVERRKHSISLGRWLLSSAHPEPPPIPETPDWAGLPSTATALRGDRVRSRVGRASVR